MKAVVFFDANNWYHNVKKLFEPSRIDIVKLALFICDAKGYELEEIRWYSSVPSIIDGQEVFYRHMSFLESLRKKGIIVITRKLQRLSNKEILSAKAKAVADIGLCDVCKPLVESRFMNMASVERKEKGIDVWIAIDMIRMSLIEKDCEACILVSGDADFVPALDLIRKSDKQVLTAMVPRGYSSELIKKFPFFILRKDTLLKCSR